MTESTIVLCIFANAGEVGKSTLAVHLAQALSESVFSSV